MVRIAAWVLFLSLTRGESAEVACDHLCAALQTEAAGLPTGVELLQRHASNEMAREKAAIRQGAADAAAPFWPTKGGNSFRSGAAPFQVPTKLDKGPTWTFKEDPILIRSSPVIDDQSNIYFTSTQGNAYKLSKDGGLVWKQQFGQPIYSSPALSDGMLFVVTKDAVVHALNVADGTERWGTKVGNNTAPDAAYVHAGQGVVLVAVNRLLDPSDVVGPFSGGNHLVALELNGTIRWHRRVEGDTEVYNFQPLVINDTVIYTDIHGLTRCLALDDGWFLWSRICNHAAEVPWQQTGGAVLLPPNGDVVVSTCDMTELFDQLPPKPEFSHGSQVPPHGRLSAFDRKDGARLWQIDFDLRLNSPPAVGPIGPGGTGPMAFVVALGENPDFPFKKPEVVELLEKHEKKGRIAAVDAETHKQLWSYELPEWHGAAYGDSQESLCIPSAFTTPVIGSDGTVYVGFQNGMFYSIQDKNVNGVIEDGEVSAYDAGAGFAGSPALAPGLLVVPSCTGLHAWAA